MDSKEETQLSKEQAQWLKERESLLSEIQDLKILYETIAEHSSGIENELEEKNQEISTLIQQLKKYLSPQLYTLIVGNQGKASLNYQRQFLSIFFSDIVGFTEISDRTDPEILSTILNDYLNEMAQIAIKHSGTIDKFIGDALMIFFGAPEYSENSIHASDCCKMAIEMQEKIQELDKYWIQRGVPQGLKVRMGIHSGYCTVGNFGSENRMDYTIIGGNVNIASRLESLAHPESIFISSVTRNLLPSDFVTQFNQRCQVKGIHYPIEVYELKRYKRNENRDLRKQYLTQHNNGFYLKEIQVELDSIDADELSALRDVLKTALIYLEKS